MNQFINRIASYLANEVVIKGLANSRIFQRFALRTHNSIQEAKKVGNETLEQGLDELHKASMKAAYSSGSGGASTAGAAAAAGGGGPPQPPLRGFAGFLSAFAKEVRKDLGLGK